jgi:hypothetical protein
VPTPEQSEKINQFYDLANAARQKHDKAACRAYMDKLVAYVESINEPSFEYRKGRFFLCGAENVEDRWKEYGIILYEAIAYYHKHKDTLMEVNYLSQLASFNLHKLNDHLTASQILNRAQALLDAITPEDIQKMIQNSSYPDGGYWVEKAIRGEFRNIQSVRAEISRHTQKFVNRFSPGEDRGHRLPPFV